MNKTVTMNLGGIIFHIEEDAFDFLNNYLNRIKGYFDNSQSREEIMKDIEMRIAEMLQGKVNAGKQAVLLSDVEEVIAIMGKPEEFAQGHSTGEGENNSFTFAASQSRRRRVFRDKDHNLLGGVCAGISNYFDIDPIWLRGAFAISFFVFGTGFLLYIILWMIIPEAKTTAEKLEMHGEKVDINNIGRKVQEEFDDVKQKVNNFGERMKSPENKEKMRKSAQRATDFVGDVAHNGLKVFGKVIAGILLFIGIALAIGFLATLFGRGTISIFNTGNGNGFHFSLYELCNAVLPANTPIYLVVLGLIFFIGVPLIGFIYTGARILFGIHERNKIIKYTSISSCLIGIGILVYIGLCIGEDFSDDASVKQTALIHTGVSKSVFVRLNASPDDDLITPRHKKHKIDFDEWTLFEHDKDKFRIGYPTLDIKQSDNENAELIVIRSADGSNHSEAAERAANVAYKFTNNDTVLSLDGFFDINTVDKLRGQEVKLLLKLPVGTHLEMGKHLDKLLYDVDNSSNMLDKDMPNHSWKMTQHGLECVDCKGF